MIKIIKSCTDVIVSAIMSLEHSCKTYSKINDSQICKIKRELIYNVTEKCNINIYAELIKRLEQKDNDNSLLDCLNVINELKTEKELANEKNTNSKVKRA